LSRLSSSQAAQSEPQRFGKYQILERIAAGGMAEIFKARLDGIGGFHRTFAIKRILPHLTANPEFVDMLVDEAKVAGLLSHANIVQILDLGNVDQQFYIAMEYVHGRDLGHLLGRCADKGITLPVPHAVYVLIEMLKGLEYAHHRQVMRGGRPVPLNIVHRDISPANILLSFQGEVKLTDFGIAKASVKALETMSGVVKGRFDYMSPEQASGGAVDQRSDLFSAGVVLYQLLTGRHPFRQPSELATIEAIRRGSFEPPSYVNPDVPYSLDLVVEQALKVDPKERFQTATAFKDALDRFFHDAGFIFSASTLAAFLKGLFPEAEPRPQPSASQTLPPPPPPADDVSLEEDSSGGNRATRPMASPRPAPLPPGDSTIGDAAALLRSLPHQETGAFGPVAGLADESTLIRPAPSAPHQWNDVETVIRSDPGRSAAKPAPTPLREPRPLAPAPPPQKVSPRPQVSPPRAPPLRAPPPPHTPTHVHLLYGIAVFAMLVVGFALGILVGSTRVGGGEPVVVKLDPVLEIHFPAGAEVVVDGRKLVGASPITTTLPAGHAAVVRVSGAGYAGSEARVTLDYNQMRVLTFDSMDLKRTKP
jgi:serine/threonine protein kinase